MVCSPAGHMAPQAQRVLTVPAAVDLMDHRADLMGLTVVPEDHTAVLAVWLPVALIVSLTKLNASQHHTVQVEVHSGLTDPAVALMVQSDHMDQAVVQLVLTVVPAALTDQTDLPVVHRAVSRHVC